MSNNSVVTRRRRRDRPRPGDAGARVRARAERAFNPVLLKPGSDRTSQVVLLGRVDGRSARASTSSARRRCWTPSPRRLAELRARLRRGGLRGRRVARRDQPAGHRLRQHGPGPAADLPVVVVGDIDRGGVFATSSARSRCSTRPTRRWIAGFVVNKFRGDPGCSHPGLDMLRGADRPADVRRAAVVRRAVARRRGLARRRRRRRCSAGPAPPHGEEWLRVAVVRLPRISNATDAEALACEPGVAVRYVTEPARLADADLVVLPGIQGDRRRPGLAARAPAWPTPCARTPRPAARCSGSAAASRCSGGASRDRRVESGRRVAGLGLLPVEITFDAGQDLGQPGRHGVGRAGARATRSTTGGSPRSGATRRWSTGRGRGRRRGVRHPLARLLESDGFRRALLAPGRRAGRPARVRASRRTPAFAAERAAQLDLLGDLVEEHLDTDALRHSSSTGAAGPAVRDHVRSGRLAP